MIIESINTTDSNNIIAIVSEKMYDNDGRFLCTVEVDCCRNETGHAAFIRIQDLGYANIDHDKAVAIGQRLYWDWLLAHK